MPLPAERRDRQLAHLRAVAAELASLAVTTTPPVPEPAAASAWAGQLCAACGGRCCRHGAASHAFIDAPTVARWLLAQPGMTIEAAVRAYAGRLPATHLAGSCAYHGPQGCTLDRAMRSDTCNGFACASLQRARRLAVRPAVRGLLAMVWDGRRYRHAKPVPRPAPPADPGAGGSEPVPGGNPAAAPI